MPFRGVPSPFVATTHPYPTRYHGARFERPVFGFPYVQSVQSVWKPTDFVAGLGMVNPMLRRRRREPGGGGTCPPGQVPWLGPRGVQCVPKSSISGYAADMTASAGLGEVLYSTGEGIFYGRGQQGGGVFSSALAGLGAMSQAQWDNCWNRPGFNTCHDQNFTAAQAECRRYTPKDMTYADCVSDLKDKYVEQNCLKHCGGAAPGGSGGGPTAFQKAINAALDKAGYCPIGVDGKVGKDTCAAGAVVGLSDPACAGKSGGTKPKKKPNCGGGGGGYGPGPGVATVGPMLSYGSESTFDWKKWGMVAAGGMVALGVVFYLKKGKK